MQSGGFYSRENIEERLDDAKGMDFREGSGAYRTKESWAKLDTYPEVCALSETMAK